MSSELSDEPFQVDFRGANVLDLLGAGNLALDGDRTLVVELLQARDDPRKIHLAFADGHFFSQLSWVRRPETVLGMNSLDIGREDLDGVDRIGLAVEDEVGKIKVDALIVETDVLHRAYERDGRFLPGLIAEVLSVAPAIRHDVAQGRDRLFVYRVVGIFRNEPGVTLHRGNAACFGKVRGLLDPGDARGARVARHDADRQRPIVKVPSLATWSANHDGRRLDLVLVESLQESRAHSLLEILHVHLTRGQAEIMHLGDGSLRIVPDSDDQTKTQRLLLLGEQARTEVSRNDSRRGLNEFPAVECRADDWRGASFRVLLSELQWIVICPVVSVSLARS